MIYWILFLVALLVSSSGWKQYIYFISIGYAFSIVAEVLAMLIFYHSSVNWATGLLCLAMFVYGCRLGFFLLLREIKSATYRSAIKENTSSTGPSNFAKAMIWISCSFLYLTEISPVTHRLHNTAAGLPVGDVWAWVALVVVVLGITIESVADAQKSAAKKQNPTRFVDTGLFRIVRCPNYFGEMVVWTGCFIAGFGASCLWWQWLLSIVGYVGIIYIMFSGARRLELRQTKNYGDDPRYREYVKKTPILLPLVPIYSVARHGWLRG